MNNTKKQIELEETWICTTCNHEMDPNIVIHGSHGDYCSPECESFNEELYTNEHII